MRRTKASLTVCVTLFLAERESVGKQRRFALKLLGRGVPVRPLVQRQCTRSSSNGCTECTQHKARRTGEHILTSATNGGGKGHLPLADGKPKSVGVRDSNIGVALLLAFYASEVRSIFTSRSFSLLCFTFLVAWRENNLMMLQNSDKFLGVFEPLG